MRWIRRILWYNSVSMKDFFKGVRRHIDKMDAERLREQYARL